MKQEHRVHLIEDLAYVFTKDMVNVKYDFFILYYCDVMIEKNQDKFNYLATFMELSPKLNNIDSSIKDTFFEAFWSENTEVLKDVTTKVYNLIHESGETTKDNKIDA
jgi:hypothetical protein